MILRVNVYRLTSLRTPTLALLLPLRNFASLVIFTLTAVSLPIGAASLSSAVSPSKNPKAFGSYQVHSGHKSVGK